MGNRGLTGPDPFAYPSEPHVRRHGPLGYSHHRLYLNWLRDEFSFRCVYCLRRETWLTLEADWQIDHFVPKSILPKGALDYDNLVYSCSSCNHSKAAHLAPDPCKVCNEPRLAVATGIILRHFISWPLSRVPRIV
jgi:hypothetical protein